MAHPYHHSLSSVKKWGGAVEDYLPTHQFFDESKKIIADFRHRALRHHAEGIFMCEAIFGPTVTLSTGRIIPTRWIGEQHVREDLGFIPSFADWVKAIRPQAWMGRAQKLESENYVALLEAAAATIPATAAFDSTTGRLMETAPVKTKRQYRVRAWCDRTFMAEFSVEAESSQTALAKAIEEVHEQEAEECDANCPWDTFSVYDEKGNEIASQSPQSSRAGETRDEVATGGANV